MLDPQTCPIALDLVEHAGADLYGTAVASFPVVSGRDPGLPREEDVVALRSVMAGRGEGPLLMEHVEMHDESMAPGTVVPHLKDRTAWAASVGKGGWVSLAHSNEADGRFRLFASVPATRSARELMAAMRSVRSARPRMTMEAFLRLHPFHDMHLKLARRNARRVVWEMCRFVRCATDAEPDAWAVPGVAFEDALPRLAVADIMHHANVFAHLPGVDADSFRRYTASGIARAYAHAGKTYGVLAFFDGCTPYDLFQRGRGPWMGFTVADGGRQIALMRMETDPTHFRFLAHPVELPDLALPPETPKLPDMEEEDPPDEEEGEGEEEDMEVETPPRYGSTLAKKREEAMRLAEEERRRAQDLLVKTWEPSRVYTTEPTMSVDAEGAQTVASRICDIGERVGLRLNLGSGAEHTMFTRMVTVRV